MAMEQLIAGTKQLYATLLGLYELEDRRFSYAFTLMGMLDRTPKIGIDGGWQPPPRKQKKINAKAKLERVLDDAGTCFKMAWSHVHHLGSTHHAQSNVGVGFSLFLVQFSVQFSVQLII